MSEERKIGVYLCSGCGIGDAVNLDTMESVATGEMKAAGCKRHGALCSDEGVKLITDDIASGEANSVVIAACSPRVMTDKFNFEGTSMVRANIREQVVWSHPAGDEDTQMLADDQVRMGVTQAKFITLPEAYTEGEFSETVLVVGGGFVGLTAALEASKSGHKAILVERSDRLGGWAAGWSKIMPHTPPYREPQDNPVAELIKTVEADANITVMTDTVVAKTAGMPGRFTVDFSKGGATTTETVGAIVVATGWRPYDANKLGHLGYGASPDVVTNVELEAMLTAGPVARKSDGKAPKTVAFVQCAGSRDPAHLPYCSSVCCGASIKHAIQLIDADPEVMCYVIFDELRTPGTAEEFYRSAQEKGVIFVKGKVSGVDDKLTVTYHDDLLGDDIPMEGLDMVVLATGMVPNSTNVEAPTVEIKDEQKVYITSDINPTAPITVAGYKEGVEAPAPVERPEEALPEGAPILNLQYRQGPHIPILADGFSDSHYICFPYETRRTGIYTCGPVRRPMDMGEAGLDAGGAVLKAIQAIRNVRDGRSLHPRTGDLSFPKFGLDQCTKCRRCTVECPFGAIDEREDDYPVLNPSRCRRCGTCMGACPVRTIRFDNYSVDMINAMSGSCEIPDEFSGKARILVLACENDAYPALDMAGINRHTYSAYVRVIPVRCLGSVSMLNVSEGLSKGYDGVILMGCKSGDDYQCHFVKGSGLAQERMGKVEETLKSMMLEKERVETMEIAISDSALVGKLIDDFAANIESIGLNPFKGF
ncbi:FAD-dependent oxidoreductase [Varunaivibrio sulfuroxidans]|uniref:Putative adenylylsulfate reductase-associated electron transfer protein QmoB n=1 Tax=Varunaivibrio sulfuroxidans TaxID=1773489 RepID=A0A4R3J396_9PROT|nr:FAD-dependent oxidoreductase [Varunaivibrio sulfuroxidans]TCS60309.1 putative adenylylsulfate reductase-associated electron transfer protein QmoB [Varunaivibrio sulfuroxidans]WES31004.1 FAD-dependent oxidoreductase [Varunaivibrio sulfuroxidans]